jgi:hypothetical protein
MGSLESERERERERRERVGWGERGWECWGLTRSESWHQMLGKTPPAKKAHEKNFTSETKV